MSTLHRSLFLKEIKEKWPQLIDEINAEEGLLHFEIAVFRRFAQSLIDSGNEKELVACFEVVRRYEGSDNVAMRAAIDQSFVEDLDFKSTKKTSRKWAWDLFPERLKKLYENFHGKPYA